MELSLDCVIGWKAIIDVYVAEGKPLKDIVDDYEIIRNPENAGHLIWPCHRNSINQRRFWLFNDRVDYTLYDIKNYFEGKTHKINYNIKHTKQWLDSFESFGKFIEDMNLTWFCNEKYEVINIETNEIITEYMPHQKENSKMPRKDYPITDKYLENLKTIIKNKDKK